MKAALRRVIVVVATLSASRAFAQEPPKVDNRARAQQLFDSALADAEAGNLAAACPKFLASQEADPKTSTLLNLGACYEKNGQTASAWGAFREAEGLANKIGRADWAANARSHAEALEPRLVRLTITVADASRVPGLVVTRDGVKLGQGEWGVAIPVDPGEHVVTASAEGRTGWETKQSVREVSATIAVPLLAEKPKDPTVVPVGVPRERIVERQWWTPLRTAGVIGIGVGGAAVVTGVVLGVVAKGKYDDAKANCQGGDVRACDPGTTALADSDSAHSLAGAATGVFIAGAVFVAAGTAILLFAPPGAETKTTAKRVELGLGEIHGAF